jgi:hypothetical protein
MYKPFVYAMPGKKAYTTLKALQKEYPAVLTTLRHKITLPIPAHGCIRVVVNFVQP